MRIVMFYHSLQSDWNHGNAHFLRGIATELMERGHDVRILEPADAWSRENLVRDHGPGAIREFHAAYPGLRSRRYDRSSAAKAGDRVAPRHRGLNGQAGWEPAAGRGPAPQSDTAATKPETPGRFVNHPAGGLGARRIWGSVVLRDSSAELDRELDGADLVLVHEWNTPEMVARIGRHRARNPYYQLLFHDTHHRAVTDAAGIAAFDLEHYDGVLAFGDSVREIYQRRGWGRRVRTWHEAADTRIFRPIETDAARGDLVWIGNWGDEERTAELHEFLLGPVRDLGLVARAYGVRYPDPALAALRDAGIDYGGWLPNYKVPETFARHRVTIHVPRRPYVDALPGIPTIRPFEAMACGIPLVSSPWNDVEGLFRAGQDYLVAKDGSAMRGHLRALLADEGMARSIAGSGRERILARHTCSHRVDELFGLYREFAGEQKFSTTVGIA